MPPELSEKASGGGRVRKDFRTSYAYELRRTSEYPPTPFSRQTLSKFSARAYVSSESAQEGPGQALPTRLGTAASAPLPMGLGPTSSREEGS